MREIAVGRRAVLRLFGLALASVAGPVRARPKRRKARPARLPTIVLDPGHGGVDPGAISPGGIYEKNVVLATARRLAWLLAASGRFRVVLTRSGDRFVPLRRRVAIARAAKANLFLSIHADALPDAAMRGLSVFILSTEASDREAAELAASENRDVVAGVDLARQPSLVRGVLFDLARQQTANASIAFAHEIVAVLGREVALLDHPERSAGFVVLEAPDIPSVLVELGCLSNPHEEHLLRRPDYRQKLARGLARAITDYFAGKRS
ncbi:MAG TPA: N-acetylmuramoyl-L-alanine amidase [Stellaceae bacterium]|nr:N-acetylmuramoyl-L-alanine amidase [Stellaceae bacterium]